MHIFIYSNLGLLTKWVNLSQSQKPASYLFLLYDWPYQVSCGAYFSLSSIRNSTDVLCYLTHSLWMAFIHVMPCWPRTRWHVYMPWIFFWNRGSSLTNKEFLIFFFWVSYKNRQYLKKSCKYQWDVDMSSALEFENIARFFAAVGERFRF